MNVAKQISLSSLWKCGLISILGVFVIGCATDTPFTWKNYMKLHVGMPESEVIMLMGEPASTNVSPKGNPVWAWADYGLFGSGKFASIELKDGHIFRVSHDLRYYPNVGAMAADREEQYRAQVKEIAEEQSRESERAFEESMAKIQSERKQARADYVKNNPDMSEQVKDCILNRQLCLRMTPEQVEMSWGAPSRKKISITTSHRIEEWTYPGPTLLNFEDGVLTGWETIEWEGGPTSVSP